MRALLALLLLLAVSATWAQAPATVLAYRQDIPPETPEAKAARLAVVAARRAGPIVMCHRGAATFAPEDTIEAFAAAMDLGADGWEMDIRRTADGVLVCFHDSYLEENVRAFGAVETVTFAELMAAPLWRARNPSELGLADASVRPPTLAAALILARQRAALIDLDVKTAGITNELAALLTQADVWEHVIVITDNTASGLRTLGSLNTRSYTAVAFLSRRDMDRTFLQVELAKPNPMIIVDDPRVAAQILGRPGWSPVPRPPNLLVEIPGPTVNSMMVATEDTPTSRGILLKAMEARALGDGPPTPEAVARLRTLIEQRSFDNDWRWHSLEASESVKSLVRLGAVDQAPYLAELLYKPEPRLQAIWDPSYGSYRWEWLDWRLKLNLIRALGVLRHEVSIDALTTYVNLPKTEVEKLSPAIYEEATASLLRQRLSEPQLRALLTHANPPVRNQAVATVLDGDDPARTAVLEELYPWTASLPSLSDIDTPTSMMLVR